MKFPKLVAKMENSSIKEVCVACVQEEKMEAFYTLRPILTTLLQPRSLNGEKSIQRLQSNHITLYFALGFVLIFLYVLLA
jgi:hypothetical protein